MSKITVEDALEKCKETLDIRGYLTCAWVQRTTKVSYKDAVGLLDFLEKQGVIEKPNHVGKRMKAK